MTNIVIDEERQKALELLEGGANVFLTGEAGTGKSSLAKHFLDTTKKKVLVLGSTGIAAINVGGQTVHSALRLRPGVKPAHIKKLDVPGIEIFQHVDAMLVDELSMLRGDVVDCMDTFLRLHGKDKRLPFGGIQFIGVGDICQLPPVVTKDEEEEFSAEYPSPYFFDAHCYPSLQMRCVELKRVFRQKDPEFVRVLNLIRKGEAQKADLRLLNKRHDRSFKREAYEHHIYLATRNLAVDAYNPTRLGGIKGQSNLFFGVAEGKFPRDRLPAENSLTLKEGARVMLLNNDRDKRWVNGDIGVVKGFGFSWVDVELSRRGLVSVGRHTWETSEQLYDKNSDTIMRRVTGTYMQFALRLAWAITIHKSQGQTFEKVAIDLGKGTFAHGQAYVALSRGTSLEGLVLAKKLKLEDIIFDERVREFMGKAA